MMIFRLTAVSATPDYDSTSGIPHLLSKGGPLAQMPPLLGPLACFNLSCLAILFLVLWRTANDLPPEAGVAFSDRAERFFGTLVDVFGLDLETQWEDVGKPHWQPDDDGDEARPSLTTAFSGEASLFGKWHSERI